MAAGQRIAYVRVSSVDQNDARQREVLEKHNIDRWFSDKASGKDVDRKGLKEMLDYIRAGDVVFVSEFSRLGRSTADLLDLVKRIQDKGAMFVSLKENFDLTTPSGRLQMTLLAAIAEFERSMILERQAEGIALAKRAGRYKGRKRVSVPDIEKYYLSYMSRKTSKTQIAKDLHICRNTVDRLFKEYENNKREVEK